MFEADIGRCVLLADREGEIERCIALREVGAGDICEMKRLYIRLNARGWQIEHKPVERLIEEARVAGYREMRLDVQNKSISARRLYVAFNFRCSGVDFLQSCSGRVFPPPPLVVKDRISESLLNQCESSIDVYRARSVRSDQPGSHNMLNYLAGCEFRPQG